LEILVIFFLTRFLRTLVFARSRRLAPLPLFKCASWRIAFRPDSFAGIERLPHRGSLIRAWFVFFHGGLERRSLSGKGLKAPFLIKNGFIALINTGELRTLRKSLNLQGF
jgi:hypothetical protein